MLKEVNEFVSLKRDLLKLTGVCLTKRQASSDTPSAGSWSKYYQSAEGYMRFPCFLQQIPVEHKFG